MSVVKNLLINFANEERGVVAVIFGMVFLMLSFVSGIAIDYSRVRHTETKFSAAADTATLAAGRAILNGSSAAEAESIARRLFDENVISGGNVGATYAPPAIEIDPESGGVSLSVAPVVPMTFASILGAEELTVPVKSTSIFDRQTVELAIQLDLTASMCNPCSKIAALKDATNELIDILLPDSGAERGVRIALAPFSAGVNVGSFAGEVIEDHSGTNTCAYDRSGESAASDDAPATGRFYKGSQQLPSAGACPRAAVMPLSNDKDALKTAVARLETGGTTAGQLGTNWAWNLISPNWAGIWPSESKPVAYREAKTVKAVILMTDGEYNTFEGQCDTGRRSPGCDPNGTRGRQSNARARAMCDAMKAEGVMVFTVGFQTSHPAAVETLSKCATSPDHFFQADSAAGLTRAFSDIARQFSQLRLTS